MVVRLVQSNTPTTEKLYYIITKDKVLLNDLTYNDVMWLLTVKNEIINWLFATHGSNNRIHSFIYDYLEFSMLHSLEKYVVANKENVELCNNIRKFYKLSNILRHNELQVIETEAIGIRKYEIEYIEQQLDDVEQLVFDLIKNTNIMP